MNDVVQDLIDRLDLEPHPEGGYYRRTYESDRSLRTPEGEANTQSAEQAASAILYLLPSSEVSRFHRLRSDELWFYHWGEPLTLHVLGEEGYRTHRLGPNLENRENPQQLVPAGNWFGATVETGFTLVSCVVVPEFDFEDYELADPGDLKKNHPDQEEIIERLTDA